MNILNNNLIGPSTHNDCHNGNRRKDINNRCGQVFDKIPSERNVCDVDGTRTNGILEETMNEPVIASKNLPALNVTNKPYDNAINKATRYSDKKYMQIEVYINQDSGLTTYMGLLSMVDLTGQQASGDKGYKTLTVVAPTDLDNRLGGDFRCDDTWWSISQNIGRYTVKPDEATQYILRPFSEKGNQNRMGTHHPKRSKGNAITYFGGGKTPGIQDNDLVTFSFSEYNVTNLFNSIKSGFQRVLVTAYNSPRDQFGDTINSDILNPMPARSLYYHCSDNRPKVGQENGPNYPELRVHTENNKDMSHRCFDVYFAFKYPLPDFDEKKNNYSIFPALTTEDSMFLSYVMNIGKIRNVNNDDSFIPNKTVNEFMSWVASKTNEENNLITLTNAHRQMCHIGTGGNIYNMNKPECQLYCISGKNESAEKDAICSTALTAYCGQDIIAEDARILDTCGCFRNKEYYSEVIEEMINLVDDEFKQLARDTLTAQAQSNAGCWYAPCTNSSFNIIKPGNLNCPISDVNICFQQINFISKDGKYIPNPESFINTCLISDGSENTPIPPGDVFVPPPNEFVPEGDGDGDGQDKPKKDPTIPIIAVIGAIILIVIIIVIAVVVSRNKRA